MARTWTRVELEGARNSSNVSFAIPGVGTGSFVMVWFNGVLLFEVGASPDVDEMIRAGSNVTLGLAPAADAFLWAQFANEAGSDPLGDLDDIIADSGAGAAEAYMSGIREVFYYNVFLRDRSDNLKEIIERDIINASWTYSPIGGCMEAALTLRRPFDDHGDIQKDYPIEIWRDIDQLGVAGARLPAQFGPEGIQLGTSHTGARELRWSGYIFEKQPVLAPDSGGQIGEHVILRCLGWGSRMNRLVVNNLAAYEDKDVSEIVKDILDTYVVPGSKIKRTAALGLVQDTGVIVDSIQFRTYASQALQTLAAIGGNCEWGVRADREFYFAPRQNTVRQTYPIGGRIALYQPLESSDDEVHRVYLQGGDGQIYILNGAAYETGNQKELLVTVGSVIGAAAANLWGVGFFADRAPGNTTPSGRLQLAGGADWIERVGEPIGLLRVIGGPVFVSGGDRLPAQFPIRLAATYGGYTDQSFRVAQITYTPENDSLKVDIALGARSHEVADLLSAIEFKLGETNQALLQ